MQYRALKNFKIGRTTTQAGELYSGDDVEYLLGLQLIECVPGTEDKDSLEEPVESLSLSEPEIEPAPEVEAPKKGKKKKG